MPDSPARPRLLGCRGCGSAIAECALALARVPYDYEEVDYAPGSPTRERLLAVNPLGQVPALVLPDGRVLTETLAIVQWLHGLAPQAGLVPGPADPEAAGFHRWIVFLVAAVYPTFTYGDDPRRWVADEAGAARLRESTDRHRERLWQLVEEAAGSPWFLGERMSAIDLYLLAMTRWRPGRKWFESRTPRLAAIAARAAAREPLAAIAKHHFG